MKFQNPLEKEIPRESEEEVKGLMRMKEAREAVPRKENESRSQWKSRVFQHKREEEQKLGLGGKAKGKGKKN